MQIELQIIKSGVKDLVHLLHHVVTIYLTLIGALVVTHAMLRRLTSRRCIIIIIIITKLL